jgi:hypothetical protein
MTVSSILNLLNKLNTIILCEPLCISWVSRIYIYRERERERIFAVFLYWTLSLQKSCAPLCTLHHFYHDIWRLVTLSLAWYHNTISFMKMNTHKLYFFIKRKKHMLYIYIGRKKRKNVNDFMTKTLHDV